MPRRHNFGDLAESLTIFGKQHCVPVFRLQTTANNRFDSDLFCKFVKRDCAVKPIGVCQRNGWNLHLLQPEEKLRNAKRSFKERKGAVGMQMCKHETLDELQV